MQPTLALSALRRRRTTVTPMVALENTWTGRASELEAVDISTPTTESETLPSGVRSIFSLVYAF